MMNKVFFSICILLFCSCVQETYVRKLNFEVDMSKESSIQTVGVRGGFQPLSWNEDLLLADPDSNGIYTGSVTLDTPFKFVDIKFVKNGTVWELDGQDNRRVDIWNKEESTYKAIFNEVDPNASKF